MRNRTSSERRAYDAAKNSGTLGSSVVYCSAPATQAQLQMIGRLYRKAGYRFESEAVKAVLGKNPVGNLNRDQASRIIDHLQSR